MNPRVISSFALKVTLAYALGATLWIYFSDDLLSLVNDLETLTWLSRTKGLVFVAATTVLLHIALQRAQQAPLSLPTSRRPDPLSRLWGRPVLLYAVALLSSLGMLWFRLAIGPAAGEHPLLVLFMFPIVLSALLGGIGPGLLATATCAIGIDYWAMAPYASLRITDAWDLFQLLMLIINGVLVSALSESLHRAHARSLVAEDLAEEERTRLRTILRMASDGIHILDRKGRLIDANAAFLSMLGHDASAIGRLTVADWECQYSPAEQAAIIDTLCRTEDHLLIETRHRCADGRVIDVEINVCAIQVNGEAMIYASSRDITERKRNQAELEQHRHHLADLVDEQTAALRAANAALAERAEEIADLYNNAPCGYHCVDADGRFLSINDTALSWLGYRRDEVVGRRNLRDLVAPHSLPALERNFAKLSERGHIEEKELDFVRSDGSLLPVLLSATAVRDADGRLVQSRATLFDNTDRKRAEEELRIAAVAFESRDAMIVTDRQGVILRVNRAFCEMSGFSPEEAVGRTAAILSSGRQDAAFYRRLWEAVHHEGYWQGEIWNRHKDGRVAPEWLAISAIRDNNGEITHFFAEYSDISEPREAERRLIELAHYDPLTGLPNRSLLLERLPQAIAACARRGHFGALLFIDLDRFNTLNDSLGHARGDTLLARIGQRLREALRHSDTAARIGGDEFVVLIDDCGADAHLAAAQAEQVARKLRAALAEPLLIDDVACHLTASVGITLFRRHDERAEALLQQADLALHQAKEAGRDTVRFFNPAMQAEAERRARVESGLRRALRDNELVLHYQPQVDRQGRLLGVEALLRWQSPERGLVPPDEFIPIAEESGLILSIGDWVLRTACAQIAQWGHDGATAGLSVAVNISAPQFRQPDFIAQVRQALADSGANPARLKLELTESSVVDDMENVIATMQTLRQLGVGFSMDDFGTGYSSLANLKRLPIEQLKIDRGFVRDIPGDPDDCAIARAVIALGQSLHLDVIAEGVETAAQRDFLAGQGCQAYQGYLFGRPQPVAGIEQLVRLSQPLAAHP